jgi:hypothetical protein
MAILYSRNRIYAINTENKIYLFVQKDHVNNALELNDTLKQKLLKKVEKSKEVKPPPGYTCLRFRSPFKNPEMNDCLRMAEELTCGIANYNEKVSVLKEKITGLAFGYQYGQNSKIASRLKHKTYENRVNDNALPNVGETYAIIRTSTKEGENPYHIAHVLFNDGDTNITLEANAGNKDLKYPEFEIYGFKNDGTYKTFYSTYKDIYEKSVAAVLVPRDIPENKKNVKTGVSLNKTKKNRSRPLVHVSPVSNDDGRKRGRSASPEQEDPLYKRPKSNADSPIANNITHKTRSSSRSSSRSESRTVEMTDLSKPKEGSYNTRSKSPSPMQTSPPKQASPPKSWFSRIFTPLHI